jgi:hypothetical protein
MRFERRLTKFMLNDYHERHAYDADESFYEQTAYNEGYYIEREQELIRQSNFELEFEGLEGSYIQEIVEEVLPSHASSPRYSPQVDYSLEVF